MNIVDLIINRKYIGVRLIDAGYCATLIFQIQIHAITREAKPAHQVSRWHLRDQLPHRVSPAGHRHRRHTHAHEIPTRNY